MMAGGLKVSVKVRRNNLPQISRALPVASNQIVQTRGPQMVPIAKDHSRVDKGEMRDGWRWERTGQASGQLVNDVDHTVFNEFGTINMSAQPMARPAAEAVFPLIKQDFANLEKALDL